MILKLLNILISFRLSFDGEPRAKIIKREHENIRDLETFMKFMRFNNYLKDEFSKDESCEPKESASAAIAARYFNIFCSKKNNNNNMITS